MACVQFNKGNCTFLNGPLKRNYRHSADGGYPKETDQMLSLSLSESPSGGAAINYDANFTLGNNQYAEASQKYAPLHSAPELPYESQRESRKDYFDVPALESQVPFPYLQSQQYPQQGSASSSLTHYQLGYPQNNDLSHSSPHTPMVGSHAYTIDQFNSIQNWKQPEEKGSVLPMHLATLASQQFPTPPSTVLRQLMLSGSAVKTESSESVSTLPTENYEGAELAFVLSEGEMNLGEVQGTWDKSLRTSVGGGGYYDIGYGAGLPTTYNGQTAPAAPTQGQIFSYQPVQAPGGYLDGNGGVMWEDVNGY